MNISQIKMQWWVCEANMTSEVTKRGNMFLSQLFLKHLCVWVNGETTLTNKSGVFLKQREHSNLQPLFA